MSKYIFLQPRVVTTGDTVGYMNVIATDKNGYVNIINTGSTINTLSPDKNIVVGDVVTRPGDYKQVPGNLHVDGDIVIASAGDITIGSETIKHEAFLTVEGYINCTGTIDIQGTFFPGYAKAEVGPAGTSGSSGSDGSAGQMGSTGTSGISGTSGESGSSGSSGESGSSGTSGATGTTGSSGTGGTAGTGIPMEGMLAWYKADAGVTSSGGLISQWDDQSGNNYHLYGSGDNQPYYGDIQLNGMYVPNTVADWTSSSTKKMETALQLPDIGSTGTIFMVGAQYAGETFYNYFFESATVPGIIIARNSASEQFAGSIDNSDSPPYVSIAAATDATFYTARLTGDGTNSKLVLNGTIIGNDFPQTPGTVDDTLMLFYGSSGRPGRKSIAELIIYSDLLSNVDIATVEDYLRTKWGHY